MTIYFLDQEYMHVFCIVSEKLEVLSELANVTNQTFIMKHRPVTPGWSHKNFSRVSH